MTTTVSTHRASAATWLGAAAVLQFALPWVLARWARRAPVLDDVDCHAHTAH